MVVELIGGLDKAKEFIETAMRKGKHVVTANKALLAERSGDLCHCPARGSVPSDSRQAWGGIPIIRALKDGLAANRITSLIGILNGTSNYILTRMTEEGLPYTQVVQDAVALGFAEDPPTLDVEGIDAAHKLTILSTSLCAGTPVSFSDIFREGITALTPDDIRFAGEFGYRVKLLAIARDLGGSLEARVHPAMIPRDHILANVNGAYNAIYLEGDFLGPNLYYGLGAGRRPTGSAVVADIMELARQIRVKAPSFSPPPPPWVNSCARIRRWR